MRHDLFLYDSDDRMVGKMAPFLESGLADGEAVVVILEQRKWELLADALDSDADTISYIDRDTFYHRPEAAIAGYDRRLREFARDGAKSVRAFAELPRCETEREWNSWIAYEATVNRALAHHPFWVTCGYDGREMPEQLLKSGFETHPCVLSDDRARSPRYHDPEEVVRSRTPTPVPLTGLQELPIYGDAQRFRECLSAELEAAGVSPPESQNMLIAAGEVLANAQQHGGGTLSVRVGRVGDRFACEVSDAGPGISDPLVGFVPPQPGHAGGAGLWVARQLTRQLELVSSPHGFSVRLWI
ncbi:MAG TPA: sensor histidine kinase [Solirubrobacteraceae bacterium]